MPFQRLRDAADTVGLAVTVTVFTPTADDIRDSQVPETDRPLSCLSRQGFWACSQGVGTTSLECSVGLAAHDLCFVST